MLDRFRLLHGVGRSGVTIALEAGEDPRCEFVQVDFVAPRSTTAVGYGSVSYRPKGGNVTLRAGGANARRTVERPIVKDTGLLAITSRRLVFVGSTRHFEWRWADLVAADLHDSWMALPVRSQQRVYGVGIAPAHWDGLVATISTAWGMAADGVAATYQAAAADFVKLWEHRPEPPRGMSPDPRVIDWVQRANPVAAQVNANIEAMLADAARSVPRDPGPAPQGDPAAAGGAAAPSLEKPPRVAGQPVDGATQIVRTYLAKHAGTFQHFDELAGSSPNLLTSKLIASTRTPWMNSRITQADERWLLERSETAPWASIPLDARLVDADPVAAGGLYDAAMAVWTHFMSDRPSGFAVAKMSKVLYLMRPHLFPILDTRLSQLYDKSAAAAAAEVSARRPEIASRWNYWAAIRLDVLDAADWLASTRQVLAVGTSIEQRAATTLSDVRLVDILSWTPAADED
jgi:hypothetical protein